MRDGVDFVDAKGDPLLGQTIGSFRIARLIGAGAMGRVYRGVQPSIGGRVAIKFLSEGSDGAAVERFFAEARAVNMIRHEHVVDVLDLSTFRNRPYIVMEHLEGAPLSKLLSRGRLPLGGLLRIAGEVLAAVGAAHQAGIVHRDLKPDNVFISPSGHAKVLDFGIAKLARANVAEDPTGNLTNTGALVGTPKYMSPEQARGDVADARADLYSIGVILYEACVGVTPFVGNAVFELLRAHVEQAPVPPRARGAPISEAFEAVILRALAKDPSARFQTALEMSAALEAIVPTLPVEEQVGVRVEPDGSMSGERLAPLRSGTSSGSQNAVSSPPAVTASASAPRATRPASKRWNALPIAIAGGIVAGAIGLVVFVLANRGPTTVGSSESADEGSKKKGEHGKHSKKHDDDGKTNGKTDESAAIPQLKLYEIVAQELLLADDIPKAERMSTTHFEPLGWLPTATKRITAVMPDAELIYLSFPVDEHDVVDLTTVGGAVTYGFISAGESKKPGVQACRGSVAYAASALVTQVLGDNSCVQKAIAPPKCKVSEVTARARAKGLTGRLQLSYLDMGAGVKWTIATGAGSNIIVSDDCT